MIISGICFGILEWRELVKNNNKESPKANSLCPRTSPTVGSKYQPEYQRQLGLNSVWLTRSQIPTSSLLRGLVFRTQMGALVKSGLVIAVFPFLDEPSCSSDSPACTDSQHPPYPFCPKFYHLPICLGHMTPKSCSNRCFRWNSIY